MSERTGGQIVPWPLEAPLDRVSIADKIQSALSVFHAIEAGELLSAVPEGEIDRSHYNAALGLLALAERELATLHAALIS